MGLGTRDGAIECVSGVRAILKTINPNTTYKIKGSEQIEQIEAMLEWIEDIPKLWDKIEELENKAIKKQKIVYRKR